MRTGDLLGDRFELVRHAGRGGMGEVWVARDSLLGREVAVKVLDLGATQDPTAAERFQREARATAALGHPHVVTVYDHGTDGSVAFLVMELLAGPDVGVLVRRQGPLPVDRALEIAEQAAGALAASHAAGVVHRDVKPGNLVLDARGRVKVLDFGIARLEESSGRQLTAAAMVIGSAAYMSPEQASGQPASAASDLYALGCVLATLLTGDPPFAAEHPVALLRQHIEAPAPDPRDRRAEIPAAVARLVLELLRKDPAWRPSSAEVVRARLAGLRSGAEDPPTAVLPAPAGDGGPRGRRADVPRRAAALAVRAGAGARVTAGRVGARTAAGVTAAATRSTTGATRAAAGVAAGATRAAAWLRSRPRTTYVAVGVGVLALMLVVAAAAAGAAPEDSPRPPSPGAGVAGGVTATHLARCGACPSTPSRSTPSPSPGAARSSPAGTPAWGRPSP